MDVYARWYLITRARRPCYLIPKMICSEAIRKDLEDKGITPDLVTEKAIISVAYEVVFGK